MTSASAFRVINCQACGAGIADADYRVDTHAGAAYCVPRWNANADALHARYPNANGVLPTVPVSLTPAQAAAAEQASDCYTRPAQAADAEGRGGFAARLREIADDVAEGWCRGETADEVIGNVSATLERLAAL